MLRSIILSFFLLFSIINSASSEKVKKILIDGNKRVSADTIKLFGNIKLNNDYDKQDLNDILKELYETNFFKDVKISLK